MTLNRNFLRVALGCAALWLAHVSAMAALPIQHWTQPSGANIYFVESPSIPIVDVQIDFDAGARRDPADKPGLARATADMSSKGIVAANPPSGGAYDAAMDENQISEAWADLGAGFGQGATPDRMSFSLRTLNYQELLPKAAQLAAREIGEPAFPDSIWARERARMTAAIREANTRPGVVAGHAYSAAVYGNHPYGYEATEASLARVTVDDMRQVWKTIQPCRAKVSIVGAVSRAGRRAGDDAAVAAAGGQVRAFARGARGGGTHRAGRARHPLQFGAGPGADRSARL